MAASAVAHKITFATDTAALLAGANLSQAKYNGSGLTDTNNGYFIGGYSAAVSAVGDKVSLATETTAAVVGTNLTTARTESGSISNIGLFGYIIGGYEAAKSDKVDKVNFTTDTTAASSTLASAISKPGGLSAANSGYSCGGSNAYGSATGITTAVESVSFATDAFAAVAGAALPTAQTSSGAISTLN